MEECYKVINKKIQTEKKLLEHFQNYTLLTYWGYINLSVMFIHSTTSFFNACLED